MEYDSKDTNAWEKLSTDQERLIRKTEICYTMANHNVDKRHLRE